MACEAIAVRYAWLAGECRRQIDVRAHAEQERRMWVAAIQAEQAADAAKRQQRVIQSAVAIGQFAPGSQVRATVRGHDRAGEVLTSSPP